MTGDPLATVLRRERLLLGLTQTDLAGWIGVSRTSVANFEAGRQDMTLSKVLAYADAVGCDILVFRRAAGRPDAPPSEVQ